MKKKETVDLMETIKSQTDFWGGRKTNAEYDFLGNPVKKNQPASKNIVEDIIETAAAPLMGETALHAPEDSVQHSRFTNMGNLLSNIKLNNKMTEIEKSKARYNDLNGGDLTEEESLQNAIEDFLTHNHLEAKEVIRDKNDWLMERQMKDWDNTGDVLEDVMITAGIESDYIQAEISRNGISDAGAGVTHETTFAPPKPTVSAPNPFELPDPFAPPKPKGWQDDN